MVFTMLHIGIFIKLIKTDCLSMFLRAIIVYVYVCPVNMCIVYTITCICIYYNNVLCSVMCACP